MHSLYGFFLVSLATGIDLWDFYPQKFVESRFTEDALLQLRNRSTEAKGQGTISLHGYGCAGVVTMKGECIPRGQTGHF